MRSCAHEITVLRAFTQSVHKTFKRQESSGKEPKCGWEVQGLVHCPPPSPPWQEVTPGLATLGQGAVKEQAKKSKESFSSLTAHPNQCPHDSAHASVMEINKHSVVSHTLQRKGFSFIFSSQSLSSHMHVHACTHTPMHTLTHAYYWLLH